MKYVVKMMSGETYNITEEEYKQLAGASGLVYFPSINGMINLSSVSAIMQEGNIEKKRIKLHDSGYAIKKHGTWIDEYSGANIDLSYYPYLAKDMDHEDYKKLNSGQ